MIKIDKKKVVSNIFMKIRIADKCFETRRGYFKGIDNYYENFFLNHLNMAEGFVYIKKSIELIKLLNYIDNKTYIKNNDDIMILEIIYMEIFEKLEKLIKENRLDRKIINIYLLRKIGKRRFKKNIKEIY